MRRKSLLLVALCALLLNSCSRMPSTGEPIGRPELTAIAERLASARPEETSFRGAGRAWIRVSGRTVEVAFASVCEPPGWMRADLRPDVAVVGASLAAFALLEGDCARLYFPAKLLEVSGCLSDVVSYADWLDPAALLLGLPDPGMIAQLTDASVRRGGGAIVVSGTSADIHVSVRIDAEADLIERIEIGSPDDDRLVVVEYEDHSAGRYPVLPRVVRLTAAEGTTHELYVELLYDSLKPGEPVDRSEYSLDVPPGVLKTDWRDLNIWR